MMLIIWVLERSLRVNITTGAHTWGKPLNGLRWNRWSQYSHIHEASCCPADITSVTICRETFRSPVLNDNGHIHQRTSGQSLMLQMYTIKRKFNHISHHLWSSIPVLLKVYGVPPLGGTEAWQGERTWLAGKCSGELMFWCLELFQGRTINTIANVVATPLQPR